MTKCNSEKILISIFSIILCFFLFLSLIFIHFGREKNEYVVEGTINQKANEKYIRVNKINIDGADFNLEKYQNENIKYNSYDYTLKAEDTTNFEMNFSASVISKIKLEFYKDKFSGSVNIYKNGTLLNTIDLYDDNQSTAEFFLNDYSLLFLIKEIKDNVNDLIIISGVSLCFFSVFYLCLKNIVNFIKNRKENKIIKLIDIITYIICLFVILICTFFSLLYVLNYLIIIPIVIILLSVILYTKNSIKQNILNIFILITIPVGMIIGLLIPPFNVPDELSHFYKGYINSFTNSPVEYMGENDGYQIFPPKSIEEFAYTYRHSIGSAEYRLSPRTLFTNFSRLTQNEKTSYRIYVNNIINLYNVPYTMSTFIMTVSKIMNMPVIAIFFITRFMNYLIWAVLGYYTLKIVPKFKKSFLILLSMPIMLQQAFAINQDFMTNALFFILVALIIRESFESKKISNKRILLIVTLSILLAFCKMGYFPVIFLVLLMPLKKFRNKKDMLVKKCFIILPIMAAFVYTYYDSYSGAVDPSKYYTLGYLLHNPIEMAKLYLTTIYEKFDYELFRGLVDGFAYSTKYYKGLISIIIQFIFMILLFSKEEDFISLKIKERIAYFFSSVVLVGVILTALLGCTTIGHTTIQGLQPRYFLPVLLLLTIVFSNKYLVLNVKNLNFVYSILLLFAYTLIFFSLITGFYV